MRGQVDKRPAALISVPLVLMVTVGLQPAANGAGCPPGLEICISQTPSPLYHDSLDPGAVGGITDPTGEGFGALPPASSFTMIDGQPVIIAHDGSEKSRAAWAAYARAWTERRQRDGELQAARAQTHNEFSRRLRSAIDLAGTAADTLADAVDFSARLAEQQAALAAVADLDGQLDRTLDAAKTVTTDITDVPLVPPGTRPDFVDKTIDPAHSESFDFATPRGTPQWDRLVEADRYYRAAQAFVEGEPLHKGEREGLLAVADLSLHVADVSYAGGNAALGDGYVDAAKSLIDTVFDYSINAVRSAINSRTSNYLAGFIQGLFGLPSPPSAGFENEFYKGEAAGASLGLVADLGIAAAVGTAMAAAFTVGTGGLGPLAVAASAVAMESVVAAAGGTIVWGGLTYLHLGQLEEAQRNIGLRKVSGTDNFVYHSLDPSGKVQYVGITNNLAKRAADHLRKKGIIIDKLLGGLTRSDARAVEQVLIQIHGLRKNGGTLMNRINSIAKSNPIYARALERGHELLKSIGYTGAP